MNFTIQLSFKGWQLRGVQEPLKIFFNAGNKEVFAYRFDWDNIRFFYRGF